MKILKEYPIYAQLDAARQREKELQAASDNFAARDAEPLQACLRCGQPGQSGDMTEIDCNLCNPVVHHVPFPHDFKKFVEEMQ